jgi:hypothetical protein
MIDWLRQVLGMRSRGVPPHIQEALDTADEAARATSTAHSAVRDYWEARQASDVLDDYAAAEARRYDRRRRMLPVRVDRRRH